MTLPDEAAGGGVGTDPEGEEEGEVPGAAAEVEHPVPGPRPAPRHRLELPQPEAGGHLHRGGRQPSFPSHNRLPVVGCPGMIQSKRDCVCRVSVGREDWGGGGPRAVLAEGEGVVEEVVGGRDAVEEVPPLCLAVGGRRPEPEPAGKPDTLRSRGARDDRTVPPIDRKPWGKSSGGRSLLPLGLFLPRVEGGPEGGNGRWVGVFMTARIAKALGATIIAHHHNHCDGSVSARLSCRSVVGSSARVPLAACSAPLTREHTPSSGGVATTAGSFTG